MIDKGGSAANLWALSGFGVDDVELVVVVVESKCRGSVLVAVITVVVATCVDDPQS